MNVLWFWIGMALASQAPAGTKELKVVVPGIFAYANVPDGTADVLTDLLLEALLSRHSIRALGPSDTRSLLTAEQQKQLLGCKDESCMAELAGAMGADWLIAGTVGKLEDLVVINLQIIDARLARVTARASARLPSLKAAPEELGPLVDKLIGNPPRPQKTPASLAKAPVPDKPVMDPHSFCKELKAYLERMRRPPHEDELVRWRRALLLDFTLTPFPNLFVKKQGCLWTHLPVAENDLVRQLNRSGNNAQARVVKTRLNDLLQFKEQVQILQEAYPRALEMEKMGTGRRLSALPFDVKAAPVHEPEDNADTQAFRLAYQDATEVLAEALQAAEAGDKQRFIQQFTPDSPDTKSRTPPENAYSYVRSAVKLGKRVGICPLGIKSASRVEGMAKNYKKRNILEALWRAYSDESVRIDSVHMKKHDGAWRIHRW